MPCFTRERSLAGCLRRDKTDRDVLAPKPVHPRAIQFHGLFGMSFVHQHFMVDDRWTPHSLTEQYGGMTDLLSRRVIYKHYESKANRQRYFQLSKRLKIQCRDGRAKLQNVLTGNNAHKIRHYLNDHKDMQRLYHRMPIHLVADNINQRTFVLRKERDRLEFLLGQRKREYRDLLINRAVVENRIKYQNEFVLEEELKSRVFIKNIENSNVRLKAIKTIHNTYKKMIQVLLQDEIFYEPILRSLNADMEDQSNFIKHILYLGMPAISKFKELNIQYRQIEDKARKNLQEKIQMLNSLKKPIESLQTQNKNRDEISKTANPKRYLRETKSMMILQHVVKSIERMIKNIKFVTLCSQAREIYPRMKSQVDNNVKLHRLIENDMLAHEVLETKMKCSVVLKGVLLNNLSEEEINRLERIRDLRKSIVTELDTEKSCLEYLKNRGDAYVMLRVNMWNLVEIMRHVDRQPKALRNRYPNSYLKLPLLKFEMLNMRAAAPEIYEENTEVVMHVLKRKVYKLMKGYLVEMKPTMIKRNIEEYHTDFLASRKLCEEADDDDQQIIAPEEDMLQENKTLANVPNRRQIKAWSAKFLEDLAKRDE